MKSHLVLIGCCAAVFVGCLSRSDNEVKLEPAVPELQEFELTTSSGAVIHSKELQGKAWVASYFFTECGANCRMLNMAVSKLAKEYGPRGVHFVSLTCDPMRDTPQVLAAYSQLFNADAKHWTFTTGKLDYLQRIGTDIFDVSVSERSHHARITILDKDGELRGTFDVLVPDELKRATRILEQLSTKKSKEPASDA